MTRHAQAITTLRNEVNTRWPDRSKVSDGIEGDPAHAAKGSATDHNAWLHDSAGVGVFRAFDCTAAGIDANAYAEHIRQLGKAGDPRLKGGGYVIWNKRIASEKGNWEWRKYTGANGHTHHVHTSVSRNQSGYDSTAPWGIARLGMTSDAEEIKFGNTNNGIEFYRAMLMILAPVRVRVDGRTGGGSINDKPGYYGPATREATREAQRFFRKMGIIAKLPINELCVVDGIAGPKTLALVGAWVKIVLADKD